MKVVRKFLKIIGLLIIFSIAYNILRDVIKKAISLSRTFESSQSEGLSEDKETGTD